MWTDHRKILTGPLSTKRDRERYETGIGVEWSSGGNIDISFDALPDLERAFISAFGARKGK